MITPRGEYFHERDDDPHWNESGWFSFTDDLGRELVTEGRAANMLTWPCYPTASARFTHFEWDVDGTPAAGEEQEWIPINQRRRFVRSR